VVSTRYKLKLKKHFNLKITTEMEFSVRFKLRLKKWLII
jgi:hypothetical protein